MITGKTTRRELLRGLGQIGVGAGLAGLLGGCRTGERLAATGAGPDASAPGSGGGMEYIAVRPDNWGFVGKDTGRRFVPFGCNYYDPETGHWAPRIWSRFEPDRVRRHFELMQGLGVNVCRVFLSVSTFMPQPGELSAESMRKLDTMVALGREHGVRFILSALNNWEGRARWQSGDAFSDPQRMEREDDYLEQICRHFRGDGALFAIDLINEPRVSWARRRAPSEWGGWLSRDYAPRDKADEEAIAAYLKGSEEGAALSPPRNAAAEDDPMLYAYQRFREWLGARFVQRHAQAVKRGDPDRLVTVGLVQWSFPLANRPSGYAAINPQDIAESVDYMSVHFYPILPDERPLGDSIDFMRTYAKGWVRYAYQGKPVVFEEFGWAGGGASGGRHVYSEQDQVEWNQGLIERTEDSACGWLVWPFADTKTRADISKDAGLLNTEWKRKAWAYAFEALAARLRKAPPTRTAGRDVVTVDMRRAVTTMGEAIPMYDTRYAQDLLARLASPGPHDLPQKR